jgi:hypothetical protein
MASILGKGFEWQVWLVGCGKDGCLWYVHFRTPLDHAKEISSKLLVGINNRHVLSFTHKCPVAIPHT